VMIIAKKCWNFVNNPGIPKMKMGVIKAKLVYKLVNKVHMSAIKESISVLFYSSVMLGRSRQDNRRICLHTL
jgi:hypothetical protein